MTLQQCLAWSWIFLKMAWKSMEMAWNFILAQVYEPCFLHDTAMVFRESECTLSQKFRLLKTNKLVFTA